MILYNHIYIYICVCVCYIHINHLYHNMMYIIHIFHIIYQHILTDSHQEKTVTFSSESWDDLPRGLAKNSQAFFICFEMAFFSMASILLVVYDNFQKVSSTKFRRDFQAFPIVLAVKCCSIPFLVKNVKELGSTRS